MLRRVVLLTLLVVAVTAAPAYADWWSAPEPVGDATAFRFEEEPEPCGTVTEAPTTEGDITRLSARLAKERVRLTLAVTGLVSARRTHAEFLVRTAVRDWTVDVDRWRGRTTVSVGKAPDLSSIPEPDPEDPEDCGWYTVTVIGTGCTDTVGTIDVEAGTISAVLPRRCLRSPRWIRVGASVSGGGGTAVFSDTWSPTGADNGDWRTPVLGPKVRVGPR